MKYCNVHLNSVLNVAQRRGDGQHVDSWCTGPDDEHLASRAHVMVTDEKFDARLSASSDNGQFYEHCSARWKLPCFRNEWPLQSAAASSMVQPSTISLSFVADTGQSVATRASSYKKPGSQSIFQSPQTRLSVHFFSSVYSGKFFSSLCLSLVNCWRSGYRSQIAESAVWQFVVSVLEF